MSADFQNAITEALADISARAGKGFTTAAGAHFTAWPVASPRFVPGRLTSSPDTLFHYETLFDLASLPFTGSGAKLTGDDGKTYTLSRVEPKNPMTGVTDFSIHAGR